MGEKVSLKEFFRRLDRKGRRQITLMFVPHSQKKIKNFHISYYTIVITVAAALLTSIVAFGLLTNRSMRENEKSYHVRIQGEYAYHLEAIRAEVASFLESVDYRGDLNSLFARVGLIKAGDSIAGIGGVDDELDPASHALLGEEDLQKLDEIMNELALSSEYFESIEGNVKLRKSFVDTIPNRSPVVDGAGVLRFRDTGKALEFTCLPATPIVAAGTGVVERVSYAKESGALEVIIRHEYGMKTAYRGLGRLEVKEGDKVTKGTTIGYTVGRGIARSPFTYQFLVATKYVDPGEFISQPFR